MFEKTPSAQVDAKTSTPETQTVASNEGDKESQVNNTAATGKTYSADDLQAIIKDRLSREAKKHQKEIDALKTSYEKPAAGAKSSPIEEDYRSKLSAFEAEKKQLSEKLTKYRQDGLRSTVVAKLATAGCVEPGDITEVLLAKGLVKLDDEDQMIVENVNNSLDDLVTDYLAKRPYLVRPSSNGGVGSKGPASPAVSVVPTDPREMTQAQRAAALGISAQPTSKKLWGK